MALPDGQDPNDVIKDEIDIGLIAVSEATADEMNDTLSLEIVTKSMIYAIQRGLATLPETSPLLAR